MEKTMWQVEQFSVEGRGWTKDEVLRELEKNVMETPFFKELFTLLIILFFFGKSSFSFVPFHGLQL